MFSSIELSFKEFEESAELAARLSKCNPFTDAERTESAREKRIRDSFARFEAFDINYFPAAMHEDYADPNEMHRYIASAFTVPGVHVVFGPRKHGKTATAKKVFIWLLLSGRADIGGTYAETLIPKSTNILKDIVLLIGKNERIQEDYKVEFTEANSDQCQFRITADLSFLSEKGAKKNKVNYNAWKYVAAFSEGRSVRGYTRIFARPQVLLGDDVETLESPMSNDAVQLRINKLTEAFQSLTDNGVFCIFGNDFTTAGALHRLKLQQEQGILAKNYDVVSFTAWLDKPIAIACVAISKLLTFSRNEKQFPRPLWFKRYAAKTEEALKILLKPFSESDWQGNFQQNPVPPEGDFFTREHYHEWTSIPDDAKGVLWVDPNLSKKSKGDTTAMPGYKYSASTDSYFIPEALCRSFADSNKLLDEVFRMRTSCKVANIGFDGNVNQESNWTNNVRNWCQIKKQPFPHVEYRRYNVDELAKNFQAVYAADKVFFPPGFAKTPDGERFLAQFFSFTGVKMNKKDDAPDSVISAHEFLLDRKLNKKSGPPVKAVDDVY
jgi:hypothetical protein